MKWLNEKNDCKAIADYKSSPFDAVVISAYINATCVCVGVGVCVNANAHCIHTHAFERSLKIILHYGNTHYYQFIIRLMCR